MDNLRYTEFGRPFLPGSLDFNISHSGECVAVGLAREMKIGIDMELIRPIEIDNFLNVIPQDQLDAILSAADPQLAFLIYWTKVECVLKAIGEGLSIPLDSISIRGNVGYYRDSIWYLQPLRLGERYCAHVAASEENFSIQTEFVTI